MNILKNTFQEFLGDECPAKAAALSYYTVFSLPPLIALTLLIFGAVLEPEQISGNIQRLAKDFAGTKAANQIETIMENAEYTLQENGVLAMVLSIAGLVFGATSAFAQLQRALNAAWDAEGRSGVKGFIVKRALSLGMVVVMGLFVVGFFVLGSFILGAGDWLAEYLPEFLSTAFLAGVELAMSFIAMTLFFAALYKILPDAKVEWRHVWLGAAVTAVLFVIGKFAISLYMSRSEPGSAFGAAGSLAFLLVWIYYSALILFLGAEFTHVWMTRAQDQEAEAEAESAGAA